MIASPAADSATTRAIVAQFCQKLQAKAPILHTNDGVERFVAAMPPIEGWQFARYNLVQRGAAHIIELSYSNKGANQISVTGILINRQLRAMRATMITDSRPDSFVNMTQTCDIIETRRIRYTVAGMARDIIVRRSDGTTETLPLNPPLDPGILAQSNRQQRASDPIIGHIDSGIDYRRRDIADHLIVDTDGVLVAMDAWDQDKHPFDADTAQSPFFPRRHGSYVVDILLQTTKGFQLLPVRYPRPDMARMGDIIDWMATNGARIIMVPMGSRHRDDWRSFFAAASRHPRLLFIVSAGNNGHDIGQTPLYPAVNDLENILVVTSTLADGQLATGSNFGRSVDIGLPAESLLAQGLDHTKTLVAGSSFAVPKLAGFAACLAAQHNQIDVPLATLVTTYLPASTNPDHYRFFLDDEQLAHICRR